MDLWLSSIPGIWPVWSLGCLEVSNNDRVVCLGVWAESDCECISSFPHQHKAFASTSHPVAKSPFHFGSSGGKARGTNLQEGQEVPIVESREEKARISTSEKWTKWFVTVRGGCWEDKTTIIQEWKIMKMKIHLTTLGGLWCFSFLSTATTWVVIETLWLVWMEGYQSLYARSLMSVYTVQIMCVCDGRQ